jgi:Sulfotransferase family
MTFAPNRPILVTGSHRSGTTWVGRMIASHPAVAYLSEPFNVRVPPSPVRHFFHHVTAGEEAAFRAYLEPLLTFRDPALYQVRGAGMWPSLRRLARTGRCWTRRVSGCRPLLKDPIAFLSADWLARTFAADVVVLIRHPAGFASSLKRLGSVFDFNDFVTQPDLIRAHGLEAFEDDFRAFAANPPDLLDQAILLWQVFATVTLRYQKDHPEWTFLRHEDLSAFPVDAFAGLLSRLGLHLTPGVRRTIERYTSAKNPSEAPTGVAHHLKLDSRANVHSWRRRLSPDEIQRIRRGTERLARLFYGDADWTERPEVEAPLPVAAVVEVGHWRLPPTPEKVAKAVGET